MAARYPSRVAAVKDERKRHRRLDKAMFGWPCDPEMEKLRDQFVRETDPAKQKGRNPASAGHRDGLARSGSGISTR